MAQWKRAGPITQRSVDRNYALLNGFVPMVESGVPIAQRIARWTSNPKVLGSIPAGNIHFSFLPVVPCISLICWSDLLVTIDTLGFHGVMVSTLDFESSDPSSNLGGTLNT